MHRFFKRLPQCFFNLVSVLALGRGLRWVQASHTVCLSVVRRCTALTGYHSNALRIRLASVTDSPQMVRPLMPAPPTPLYRTTLHCLLTPLPTGAAEEEIEIHEMAAALVQA